MSPSDTSLPIEAVLSDILSALADNNRLVLAAPPGAGKTTRVPLALLDLVEGRILLLEPRRIAARMAAARMADTLGERVGETVGLSTRIDRKISAATRIEVITDGLFTRRILADPSLEGAGAVIFDEFHERSLNVDLGLALALETQSALREDLRILVMSATLDTTRVATCLNAPVIESMGRQYPVETRYLGRTKDRQIEDQTVRAVLKALAETAGSILVFLPGAREIRRTAERLEAANVPGNVSIHPLFGALSPADQDRAVAPAAPGHRKIVLATDIAESALTIEGVHVVVDAGLARVPEYNPSGMGSTRLVTQRASRASVDQRRGRAGRLGPGVCYRLWDEAATRGLVAARLPEILNADLSGLVLALAEWGERDPARLTWMDPLPEGRVAAARETLMGLGALTQEDVLTETGRAMAKLPLPPLMAALIVSTHDPSERALAAQIAALAGERGVGGTSVDLGARLVRFRGERSARAKALQGQARRWGGGAPAKGNPGHILAAAWPGQLAQRRRGEEGRYLLASGSAAHLDASDPLAKSEWLVVADRIGSAKSARITLAAPLSEADALAFGDVQEREIAAYDPKSGRFQARRVKSLGAIILSESPLARPSGAAAENAIRKVIDGHGFDAIGAQAAILEMLSRIALLRTSHGEDWPEWSMEELVAKRADWFDPILKGAILPSEAQIRAALGAYLGWQGAQAIDRLAPRQITLPSGQKTPVDYLDDNTPLISARVQEFYGLRQHPMIAEGRTALTLSLLSPARRPVAVTRDLPGFWSGGYLDMAKDMRGRYPKHDWPEDPATAKPHEGRTKKRL